MVSGGEFIVFIDSAAGATLYQVGTAKKRVLKSAGFQSPSSEPAISHVPVLWRQAPGSSWCPSGVAYKNGCKFFPSLYPCLAAFRCTESISLPLESGLAVGLALVSGILANMKHAERLEPDYINNCVSR